MFGIVKPPSIFGGNKKIKGNVVLMKKNVLDFNDMRNGIIDPLSELLGQRVSLQLISSVQTHTGNELKGKLGKESYLENWTNILTLFPLLAGESAYSVHFELEEGFGVPEAFVINNNHTTEFFLKSLTLEDVPDQGQTYLPHQTPAPLIWYREQELVYLRGNGTGERKDGDRIYDYDFYNDLDPNSESRDIDLLNLNFYIPRDERFGHLKMSDFLVNTLKSVALIIKPAIESLFDRTPAEFDSFKDVLSLYEEDKAAWMTDEEFGREMLAGVNPVVIRRLQEFPPTSKLDPSIYGNQTSNITESHIINNLDGLSVNEALEQNKLYILDHHDSFMPFVRRVNDTTSSKIYATRTLLFLTNDGTLKPLAIELSLPHPNGDALGAVSKICTPAEQGVESTIWQLAKAYVTVNDYGHHQLVSHWLNTHAVAEPFVLATNRQLSVLHPIHKLLHPHFRDTMNINALARQLLVNGGGIIESVVFPGKYSMEISSAAYKNWNLAEQAHPADLIKRGVAVEDPSSPHGVRLLIEDYPYAVDGLEIWAAMKNWVQEYCSFYYKSDEIVQNDKELQAWWKELREVGHGDLKDKSWWPSMQTREELVETCTTAIWTTSALHAAVNFGQYPYGGYIPNRPTISRRLMPEEGTREYEELKTNPEKAFLRTITSELQSLVEISIIEVLSKHASDEVYLGEREEKWTAEAEPLQAFERFGRRLSEIEDGIVKRNNDATLKNRYGLVKFPYNLLIPNGEIGIAAKGIPNSISI
ncbi:hypothetical protein F8388_007414 [Cannabis sativa]|uniref:Lipoxygenase n=1 Tax=Cannabis sativa TaxID=3483 RepID=A0A7J6E7U2_CANSA|nr:hypothetical protein G4B88_009388 [Cannabis sativa]KAF4365581.1 hypothetical protein F8388_007414 [Cannabis sativa]